MALQIGTGTPAAALGSDGDYYLQFDPAGNRFFVGPKANGTWPNTYYSLQGPTGPALLQGTGAPAASFGAQGQGYLDLSTGNLYGPKTVGGWGGVVGNILGPQGAPGLGGQTVPSLNSASFAFGPSVSNAAALALSGTAQFIPAPGTTQPGYFVPPFNCTMVAAMFVLSSTNNPGSANFQLYEVTTGSTLYTFNVSPAGTVSNQTGLSIGLTGGYTYGWRVTGSGNAFVQASPTFSQPATQPMGISYAPLFGFTPAAAPTTATAIAVAGNNGAIAQYMPMPKTGFLYGASFINTASSNATFGLYNQAGTLIYSTSISSNTTTPQYVGPNSLSVSTQLATGYYTWRVTCSATGYFSVQPQVFM